MLNIRFAHVSVPVVVQSEGPLCNTTRPSRVRACYAFPMPRKDINEIAFAVVQQATGEVVIPPKSAKAKSGRKGGLKGGASRAKALTSKERSAIAKKAAAARWKKR